MGRKEGNKGKLLSHAQNKGAPGPVSSRNKGRYGVNS
jgi:hypothetical protein